jgi:hypothetical protein
MPRANPQQDKKYYSCHPRQTHGDFHNKIGPLRHFAAARPFGRFSEKKQTSRSDCVMSANAPSATLASHRSEHRCTPSRLQRMSHSYGVAIESADL